MNGETIKIIMGACNSFRTNTLPTVLPATLRNALPAKPSMNRETSSVSMFEPYQKEAEGKKVYGSAAIGFR